MPSLRVNAQTRKEWRHLGFFYERDDENRCWKFVGSRAGLARFGQFLRDYVANPRNMEVSEHEHYGPYMYLEVMTWTEPKLDDHAISGRREDLSRLASTLETRIAAASIGQSFRLGREYAPTSDYDLEVVVAPEGFDPASLDANCLDDPQP